MRSVTSRFVLMIATAAVAPLIIYGGVSIFELKRATKESVSTGNRRIASQAAVQIAQYIDNNNRILRSIGLEIAATGISAWQQSLVLKDAVIQFPEFREVSMFDSNGGSLATSQYDAATLAIPRAGLTDDRALFVAPIIRDEDGLPTTTISVRFKVGEGNSRWVVGELALEELWKMVDGIKVGEYGHAALFSEAGELLAHGDADKKRLIASEGLDTKIEATAALLRREPDTTQTYQDDSGHVMFAVATAIPSLDWLVLVEQPTGEAFGVADRLTDQLVFGIGFALLATIGVGWLWGRSFLTRIFALTRATGAIAAGRLDERVAIRGNDEIRQLGDAFNSMADSIVRLQDDVRKQERQAMFGRIAAGLVHDLSYPIQSVGASCKLIQRMFDNLEYRETFKRTVDRDMVAIKRVLEDLRNVARPIPLARHSLDVDRSLAEVVESMQQHSELAGVALTASLEAEGCLIEGDLFALGRVYRNLIINAIQATAPGGTVAVGTRLEAGHVQIRVTDTGCGIPGDKVSAIFEDYVTTKRGGLGLGLAISKKIVEQLDGRISVTSEVGKGSTFLIELPRLRPEAGVRAG